MPQTKSHCKNIKIILRNRYRNKKYKLAIKKAIKYYLISIKDNQTQINVNDSLLICHDKLSLAYKAIDKAVQKKVLHKNTASRKKSGLAKMLKIK